MSTAAASPVVQYLTFSGNVCARTSSVVSWSDGNVIAFCTDEGLHLMEPSVHAFSIDSSFPIAIRRQFIAAPIQPNALEFGIDRQELHLTAPRAEVFDLMLDRTLSPAVSCQQSYKGFRQASWSPMGLGPKESCVLAALTMDHRLTLYACDSGTWVNMTELSQLYHEYLKSLDFKMEWMVDECVDGYESASLKELKTKSYATAATQVAWSRNIWTTVDTEDGSSMFSILAVGMKNGSVVLWKVHQFTSTSMFPISNLMSIGLAFDSRVGLVRCLCWINLEGNSSGLLIVGGSLGKIAAFVILQNSDGVLSVREPFMLWTDDDRLEVTQISYTKVSEDLFNVVAGKGFFVIAWRISSEVVLSKSHVAGNYMQPLIGLFPEDENSFIGASADGVVVKISLQIETNEDLLLSLNRTMTDLENEHMNYYGMFPSKNRFMFGLIEGIASWHDHLLIREPFKLLLATCDEIDALLETTLGEIDHPEARLHSIADALHAVHYYLLKNKQLPDSLISLLNEVEGESSLQLSTCKLQLSRWLLRVLVFIEQDEEKAKLFKPKLQSVEELLMERQLLLILRSAADRLDAQDNHTVETLCSSFAVGCLWLRSRPTNHLSDNLKKLLNDVSKQLYLPTSSAPKKLTIAEDCRLCQKPILFENLHVGKCETGHSFGRCCLTLSICDQPFYRKCRNCSVLANCDLFDLLKEIRCPFCSIIL